MRHAAMLLVSGVLAASLLAGCNGDGSSTEPAGAGVPDTTGAVPPGGGTDTTGVAVPSTAAVSLGNIFFMSARNRSSNPAVDTVAVGGTVTWTWGNTGAMPHSVQSMGSPSFTSSGIQTGSGSTYRFTFTQPGTYQYDCAVHGTLMTGRIVVLAPGAPTAPAPAPAPPTPPAPPAPGYP